MIGFIFVALWGIASLLLVNAYLLEEDDVCCKQKCKCR